MTPALNFGIYTSGHLHSRSSWKAHSSSLTPKSTDHGNCCCAGELLGTALAGLGAVLLAAGAGSDQGVTLVGDCVCLLSACLFLVYMAIGRRLRSWMPLFVYIFPVTLVCSRMQVVAAS